MSNHYFTAAEIARLTTLPLAIAHLESVLGETIDTSAIAYSMQENAPAILFLDGKYSSVEKVLETYKGGWCHCSGTVVYSMPRIIDAYKHEGYARPLKLQDSIDIHGQSGIYISRNNGKLRACFSG